MWWWCDHAPGGEDVSVIDSNTLSKTGNDAASTTILARPAGDLAGPGNTHVDNLALEAMDEQKPKDKEWIRSLLWDESRRVVRNFLIAATAKDCGLMLTLRPMHNASGAAFPVPATSVATCPTTGQQYICKVRNLPSTRQATLIVYGIFAGCWSILVLVLGADCSFGSRHKTPW